MKTIFPALCLGVFMLAGCGSLPASKPLKQTWSSFDLPSEHPLKNSPPGIIDFSGADVIQTLDFYQKISGRTLVRGSLPDGIIRLRSQAPLTQIQVLQMLDTLLAEQGVAMLPTGENIVRAVPIGKALSENPPEINLPWRLLPESKSVMSRTVHLKNLKPSQVVPMLAPLAGLPNSIMAIDDQRLLILRDYSINIRRQSQLLEELEQKPSR
jgi:type II secretory pathway component GspD/PulD (secretin)